MMAIREN